MAALFPRRESVSGIERLALSFGLSIAVVTLIGFILNYTSWGITLKSILWSTASFIFIMTVIAWFRRKRLLDESFSIEFTLASVSWGKSIQNKVLSIVLVIVILGAMVITGYVVATSKLGQEFTEFYILGLEGETTDYPEELKVGEEGIVTIGIINHEYETVSYRVEVVFDDMKVDRLGKPGRFRQTVLQGMHRPT